MIQKSPPTPAADGVVTKDQSTPPKGPRNFWLKAAVGFGITALLVAFLWRFIDPKQLSEMLAATRLDLCLAGLGLWVLLYSARTMRFVLLAPRTPWLSMYCIASLHNFLLRLLPMRTGDLSWAFLVRRAGSAGLGESLLNLLLLRVLDILCVLVFFSLALVVDLYSGDGVFTGDSQSGLLLAGVTTVVVLFLVLMMRRFIKIGVAIFGWFLNALGLMERPGVANIWQKVQNAVSSFSSVRPRVVWLATLASLACWALTYSVFLVLMRAFGLPVNVSQIVLGATGGVISGFLPIGGIGSFGTLEAGWTLGFVLVGLTRSQAVTSGFGVSLVTFAYTGIMAAIAWPVLNILGRKR